MITITVRYNVGSNPSAGSDLQHSLAKRAKRHGMYADDGNWRYLLSKCYFTGEDHKRGLRFAKKVKLMDNVESVEINLH